jgi:hypothetical protein
VLFWNVWESRFEPDLLDDRFAEPDDRRLPFGQPIACSLEAYFCFRRFDELITANLDENLRYIYIYYGKCHVIYVRQIEGPSP